ncbi:MAG: hypothetical protein R3B51_01315 [Thermodesulfobacteriota bacterium]
MGTVRYKYSHDAPDHFIDQNFLPDELKDAVFYEPTDIGARPHSGNT